jgi:23S rRNA pseudouridine2605 synthase
MEERLQKLIAQAGIASRREAETMIERRRVTVNGVVAQIGDKADPNKDDIRIDGSRLQIDEKRVYIMLNKPMGIISASQAQTQERRRTVLDLVPLKVRLYPVGRLDADSEGLILLTNDGELAQKLTHPRYEHPKVYEVALTGFVPEEKLDVWRRGVVLDDGPTQPVEIRVISREKELTWIAITMREGRKRQIRRTANLLGHPVRRLIRIQLDQIKLGALETGKWRALTDSEVDLLQESAASTPHRRTVRVFRSAPSKSNGARPRTGSRTGTRAGSVPSKRRTAGSGTRSGSKPSSRRPTSRPSRAPRAENASDGDTRSGRPAPSKRSRTGGSINNRGSRPASRPARPSGGPRRSTNPRSGGSKRRDSK